MGQALYRKYRSKSLDEVVGQEHVTETLRRAIASGKVSHAYLFTGPRGVGKTSIARILAHELNGVQYSGEDNHLDIIEIDAASNGGVEEVRNLRDKVYIAPSNGKYKVYIIDEVHMMTTSAFNALLKTLEEPPAHAVFILATTESHKLPATIISRTQRFTFKPIAREKMIAHLSYIAKTEKIDITDDALDLIAEHSEGSFRDGIGMLDQAGSNSQKVDLETVEKLLGIPTNAVTCQLIAHLQQADTTGLAGLLFSLRANGYQAAAIAKQLAQDLRSQLLTGNPPLAPAAILSLLGRLVEVPASHNPDQKLEIVLLETCLSAAPAAAMPTPASTPVSVQQVVVTPPVASVEEHVPAKPAVAATIAPVPKPVAIEEAADEPEAAGSYMVDTQVWQALLESLKKQYNTLYGIIRMARPEFEPGKVTLTFGYAFHQKRANDPKNKKIVTSTLEEITGQKVSIICKYDKEVTPLVTAPAEKSPAPTASPALGTISNIFGGGEVIKPQS